MTGCGHSLILQPESDFKGIQFGFFIQIKTESFLVGNNLLTKFHYIFVK